MNHKRLSFLAATTVLLAAGAPPLLADDMPDIRIKVSNKSLGTDRKGDTRKSQRQLKIEIDNRDRDGFDGATVEWTVVARDINNRKLSIAGSGTSKVDIPANDDIEIASDPFSFAKTEGKVERINQNRPDREQFKVDPDTGTRYAGYVVVIKKDGKVIAEAATAGMQKRIQGLKKAPAKKK